MTTITFDGATLRNPSPLSPSEDKDSFEITIECYTDDYEDVLEMVSRAGQASVQTLLSGKKKLQTTGTLGDLVIDGLDESIDGTYSNCAIVGGVKVEESAGTGGTQWKYTVRFVQAERADVKPAWYTTALQGQAPITDPITDVIETILTSASDNYVDLPLSQTVLSGMSHAAVLTTDNYADIPLSEPIIAAITHGVTIINS